MPKRRVYLETTIVSYLTGRPSRDLVIAAHQEITLEWWERRDAFELFVSEAVLQEASGGDSGAAARREAVLEGIAVLEVTSIATDLARRLLAANALPPKAVVDAVHVAVAAVSGMDYLLTWNCAHIANAATRSTIERACREAGFSPPMICTPEELGEEIP